MKEDMAIFLKWADTADEWLVSYIIQYALTKDQAEMVAEMASAEVAFWEAEIARLKAEIAWLEAEAACLNAKTKEARRAWEESQGALAGDETGRGGHNQHL